jgi:hypothetical protein
MWHVLARGEVHTRIWWVSHREETTSGKNLCRWEDDIKIDLQETG